MDGTTPGPLPGMVSSLQSLAKEDFHSLGTLQMEKKIGQGQFSVVFRARSVVTNTCVALKKIQVSLLMQFACQYRFDCVTTFIIDI